MINDRTRPWQEGRTDPNCRQNAELPVDPAMWSATEQAQQIAVKTVAPSEVLTACLNRYERFNGQLNALVHLEIDQAVERAARLDQEIAQGVPATGPIRGVPSTIKEVFDWVGTPSTWGRPDLLDYRPERNATVVDLLTSDGAVIYGKSNVPPMLGDWQTSNDTYGTTNNPWNLTRTPGGSSGGSAAALASGMTAIEIGSDIGGSIRFPAHYTGLFGHKPSFGIVPIAGHTYPGHEGAVDVNVAGPLARSSDDLVLLMRTLAGTRLHAHLPQPRTGRSRTSNVLRDWKVGVVLDSPIVAQDSAMTDVLRRAVDALVDLGLDAHDGAQPGLSHQEAFEVGTMLVRSATSIHDAAPETFAHDLARFEAGARDYVANSAKAATMTHREWIELHNSRGRLQRLWAEYFGEFDLLLCPVAASPAPPHDHRPFVEQEITVDGQPTSILPQWLWAGWSGSVHLPSTVAPVGRTDEGLPVGIQIIAPMYRDETSLLFAQLIEWHLGGFVWPPGYGTT